MSTIKVRIAVTSDADRVRAISHALDRFQFTVQPQVRELARIDRRIADLAVTFPALLVALACPRLGQSVDKALTGVRLGAPLSEVARLAQVPMWTRRVPAEAFGEPLPRLQDSLELRRRIANHLPRKRRRAAFWWRHVSFALMWGDESYAIWVARELAAGPRRVFDGDEMTVLLWAWFSSRRDLPAGLLIDTPWTPQMAIRAALEATETWGEKIRLHVRTGDAGIADLWQIPTSRNGFTFVPLVTASEIDTEATAMSNCLRSRGYLMAADDCRLWSIRRGGERIATLEVVWRRNESLPRIGQLLGPSNKSVPLELWRIVREWLVSSDHRLTDGRERTKQAAPLSRVTWTVMWRPYWIAQRRIPSWLPLAPSDEVLWMF